MMRRRATAILFLVLLLSACAGEAQPPSAALPTATAAPAEVPPTPTATFLPPPTVTPYPTATPGGAAAAAGGDAAAPGEPPEVAAGAGYTEPGYYSSFESGWPAVEEEGLQVAAEGGQYVFALGPGTMSYQPSGQVDAANAYLDVAVTPETCPPGGGYGVFFRFRDTGNYYALTLFCDGRVTVYTRAGGTLVTQPLLDVTLPAGLEAAASGSHRIGVLAQGSNFTLYFDGQRVGSFADGRHPSGDVAVYAVSPSGSELRVLFDELGVWTAS